MRLYRNSTLCGFCGAWLKLPSLSEEGAYVRKCYTHFKNALVVSTQRPANLKMDQIGVFKENPRGIMRHGHRQSSNSELWMW